MTSQTWKRVFTDTTISDYQSIISETKSERSSRTAYYALSQTAAQHEILLLPSSHTTQRNIQLQIKEFSKSKKSKALILRASCQTNL